MTTVIDRVQSRIRETFGENALTWFDRSYTIDWYVGDGAEVSMPSLRFC